MRYYIHYPKPEDITEINIGTGVKTIKKRPAGWVEVTYSAYLCLMIACEVDSDIMQNESEYKFMALETPCS